MTGFTITPAVRHARKARIALAGPSGCGKTWTALAFGAALGDRMVVIDTERASAALYAGDGPGEFQFGHLHNLPGYEPDTLIAALHQCAAEKYDVVVIDSLTHFWSGVGGMLEQVDKAAKRNYSGNNFAGWKDVRPVERRMIDAMVSYPGHVIVTMRTKTEWVIEENDRGRKTPRKIGTKPEQREGIEYEFDLVADMDIDHTLVVTKSRCRLLSDAVVAKPDGQMVAALRDWLASGAAVPASPPPAAASANGNGQRQPGQHAAANGRYDPDAFPILMRQVDAAPLDGLRALWRVVAEAERQGEVIPPEAGRLRERIIELKQERSPATEQQLTRLHAALGNHPEITSREEKLAAVGRILRRPDDNPVTSTTELTCAEADAVWQAARDAPAGLDLLTGLLVPAGAGVTPGEWPDQPDTDPDGREDPDTSGAGQFAQPGEVE